MAKPSANNIEAQMKKVLFILPLIINHLYKQIFTCLIYIRNDFEANSFFYYYSITNFFCKVVVLLAEHESLSIYVQKILTETTGNT